MRYLLLLLLTPTLIFGQTDEGGYPTPPPFYPFSVSGHYLAVQKAHFRTPGFEDKWMRYKEGGAAFSYTHPFNELCGLIFGTGWVGTVVDMEDNPAFHDTFFNYVNFSVGGFTKVFPDWTWTLTAAAFLDTESFSFADYALYQGVLWGQYAFCKWLELDCGLILECGLDRDKVWPIIGFVFKPWDKWRLNAVYPINLALEYEWTRCLTLAGSIRFLRNRHRVDQDEPDPQGIFEYRDIGAEFDLTFSPFTWGSAKGFIGKTFDGDLKITDRNYHNAIHYKFVGSYYAGVSARFSY